MAGLYQLPPKEGNRFWPMPPDYGGDPVKWKGSGCLRCGRNVKGKKYCPICRETRKGMRLALLKGWYDPDKPGELMRTGMGLEEIFLAALNFFVDFYFRLSPLCNHQYFFPDCRHKPTMQRMFTHPRSALVAPRESGKTFTVVFEMPPFMAITRPHTPILIGSETEDLTKEKIKEIRRRVETNARIYHDFDLVWPRGRSSALDWSNQCLDFINGSSIRGSSIDQSTRGRHPLAGIIDDAEGKRSRSRNWRDKYMHWFVHDYLNQFRDKGTHVMKIGTLLQRDSCLWRIVHNEDAENRFVAWERHILKMIYEDPPESGKYVSCWPEKLSVEEFERKKRGAEDEDGTVTPIGIVAVMAEFQGAPIPPGTRMFKRTERGHGYVMFSKPDGKLAIYDPADGNVYDMAHMMLECRKYAGVDVADTAKSTAAKSGIVIGMYDPNGIWWIVDAWSRRCFSDITTTVALQMAHEWKTEKMGWEAAGLLHRIFREAYKARMDRHENGFHVPVLIPLPTDGVAKPLRIERLKPDFDAGRIKLPLFHAIDGYEPVKLRNRPYLEELIDQFDTMTIEDDGASVDLLDSTEMMHRIATRKPKRLVQMSGTQRMIEHWQKNGVTVDPMQVPSHCWTRRMREEFHDRIRPFVGEGAADAVPCKDAFV